MTRLLTLITLLLLSGLTSADTISVNNFIALPQEKSNWCWAASIQSIFLTKGLEASQSNIVKSAYGISSDGTPPNKTAPGFDGTLGILNGLAVNIDGTIWSIEASAGNTFPNANWLYKQLNKNTPIMIWYKDETSNHSIVVNGGTYTKDALGDIYWHTISAYDPWHNRDIVIDASNLPKYVYGTFIIDLNKHSTSPKAHKSSPKKIESTCPEETTPHGYIRAECEGITKRTN